ncbi:MAG: murein biosynthesis integral membrane protein MurJ [Chlamydiota bacterium]|nr:murein biosynthesis integral membrane protein MurJ [Chlamydiota bacterium]
MRKQLIVRSAGLLGLLTLFSRVLGLIRDSVIARIFGVGTMTDAFMIAFTMPNMLRRLLAEGALSIAFVPIFSGDMVDGGKEKVEESLSVLLTVVSVVLSAVTIAAMIFAPVLVSLFAPGFGGEQRELAILLTRVMFPFIIFLSSASVMVGVLHAMRHFSIPALSPILLNCAIILSAFFLTPLCDPPIISLTIGVLTGGILLWVLQWQQIRHYGFRMRWMFRIRHPSVQRFAKLMMPALFGIGVYQLNVMISRILASLLPEGNVTYLYYSDRFLELPLGIFAVSVATAILPALSERAHQLEYNEMAKTLFFSMRLMFFVCFPAMIGLMILRVPIMALVFQYGRFSLEDTHFLAHVFCMASLGIWAVGGVRILLQGFYAMGHIKETVKIAVWTLILNVILGLVLMVPMQAAGLTLANAISSIFQFFFLIMVLKKSLDINIMRDMIKPIVPMVLSACVMGLCLFPVGQLSMWHSETVFLTRLWIVLCSIMAGGLVYVVFSYMLGVRELKSVVQRFKNGATPVESI